MMKITRNYYDIKRRNVRHKTFKRDKKVTLDEIKTPTTMFLDQASEGGYCLYDDESRLFLSGTFKRGNTRLPKFKESFVKYISELVEEYNVKTIFYEEVYDSANMITTEVLFYLKHAIKDFGYFSEGLDVYGLSHKRWKSLLAKPDKFKFGSKKDDKEEIRKWVKEEYPLIAVTVQDEFDAIGMGIALMIKEKGKRNFLKNAKYNKKLPVDSMVYEDVFDKEISNIKTDKVMKEFDEKELERKEYERNIISKFRKPFREAYEVGGLVELELNKRTGVMNLFRQFLSHKDAVAYVKIPTDYKNWGILLLESGETPERFESEDGKNQGFLYICARKNRL